MIRIITILVVFFVLCASKGVAQDTPTIILDEVVLSDARVQQFSEGIKVRVLSDSVLVRSKPLLTDALLYNSSIYFRENGYGMVSSASFRGTGAQQTAVIWNGVNINSQLTGQTDFNTIIAQGFDQITIRSGGGSSQYGSGAIGGSIHLNNRLPFNQKGTYEVALGYGSFDTRSLRYKTTSGTENFSVNFGVNYLASDNDYKYLDTDRKNENGEFEHFNVNLSLGYRLSSKNLIKLYHNSFFGDRNFSGTLTAPSNDNYKDLNARSLLEWVSFTDQKTARLRVAHLYERFRYFPNNQTADFSFGAATNMLLNYDYKYTVGKWTLNAIAGADFIKAKGTSIETANRTNISGTLLVKHKLTDDFAYGVNVKKEVVNDYDSPLLFALDAKYDITPKYTVTLNGSRNFRIPTFNDLYWTGAGAAGNLNVIPETALQGEFGNSFSGKGCAFNLTGFYIRTDNLIQWRPDVSGIWSPSNVNEVEQYGLELEANFDKTWGHHQFQLNTGYAYTMATNLETQKQLIYVPRNKVTANLSYQNKQWQCFYQFLANGMVYTTTDESASLAGYALSNIGLSYTLKTPRSGSYNLGLRMNNLFNTNYQNVAFRPMPNRAINFQITSKF